MRDYFLPAKKVAMALHSLMSSQFPRDYLGIVGFSETARALKPQQLPEVSWDFVYGTNMQHGFMLAREMLSRQSGTKQIIMITDGEPTAHISQSGDVFFNYPPVRETIEATLREVMRATREGIRINTFMLDASHTLQSFIEQLTAINKGRAFFTGPENLGEYVLVYFIEHKRQLSRLGGVRRAGLAVFAFFVKVWQNYTVVVTPLLGAHASSSVYLEGFKIGRSHAHTGE